MSFFDRINNKYCRLGLLTIAHLLVDMSAISYLCNTALPNANGATVIAFIFAYNALAFGLQPLLGLFFDFKNKANFGLMLSLIVITIIAAFDLSDGGHPIFIWVNVVIFAVANAIFHTSASAFIFADYSNDARALGIFVATGAIGLAIGKLLWIGTFIGGMLTLLCSFFLLGTGVDSKMLKGFMKEEKQLRKSSEIKIIPLLLLFFAVFVRGFSGSCYIANFDEGVGLALLAGVLIAVGKSGGGFLSKYIGVDLATISLVLSALLMVFASHIPALYYIGLVLFNVSMPITLSLSLNCMGGAKCFIFGTLAMLLMVGGALGNYFLLTSINKYLVMTLTLLSAGAIILANRLIKKKERSLDNIECQSSL